jgi:hypothetical protein
VKVVRISELFACKGHTNRHKLEVVSIIKAFRKRPGGHKLVAGYQRGALTVDHNNGGALQ